MSKPHEALLSLLVTTCGQPGTGFAGCPPRDEAVDLHLRIIMYGHRSSPTVFATRLTGCLIQVGSKRYRFDLTSPRTDKMVSCVVMDSRSKNENKLFLPAAIAVSLELTSQSQTKEQKTHPN